MSVLAASLRVPLTLVIVKETRGDVHGHRIALLSRVKGLLIIRRRIAYQYCPQTRLLSRHVSTSCHLELVLLSIIIIRTIMNLVRKGWRVPTYREQMDVPCPQLSPHHNIQDTKLFVPSLVLRRLVCESPRPRV